MGGRLANGRRVVRPILFAAYAGVVISVPAIRAQNVTAAQTPDVKTPAYDVVSVKPNKTGSGHIDIDIDDENFTAANVSLKTMILSAYGLKDVQLYDLPKWSESMRFDIRAKIIDPDKKVLRALTPEQFRSMQQPILTDRFQLKFHHEMRVLPVYDLVVAKGGPKFKEITAAEIASDTGVNGVRAGGMSVHNQNLTATGVPLSSLADTLSGQLNRLVIDKTGLTGKYNLQLSWSRDDGGLPPPDAAASPDIFTALREQLGLKLQSAKAEIETFVVDHAAIPSED